MERAMLNNPSSNAMVSLIQRQDTFLREAERERLLRAASPEPATTPEPRRPTRPAGWRSFAAAFAILRPPGRVDLAR
jgi:hypothetical protein